MDGDGHSSGSEQTCPGWVIRSFAPSDLAACHLLYREGLIGKILENDTGLDIDDIASAYMQGAENHFWVAQLIRHDDAAAGEIVGMIGVQHYDGIGEIRRLRVAQDHRRRGIGTALVETAVRFCRDRDYLKITLDTFVEREPALKLFNKFRFRHERSRTYGGKELMYFYLDLYTGVPGPQKGDKRPPDAAAVSNS